MAHCPLYNGTNINFTGNKNPYSLIQNGGKRILRRTKQNKNKKTMCKRKNCKSKQRKTRKHRL